MKECCKCKRTLHISEFHKNKRRKDGHTNYCKNCKREYNADHYVKTKDQWKDARSESVQRSRKISHQYLFDYLSSHPCIDCGNSDVRVLDFDHVGEKIYNIADMIGGSLEKLIAEVKKCEIRCRNCHAIKTYERLGGSWRDRLSRENAPQALR